MLPPQKADCLVARDLAQPAAQMLRPKRLRCAPQRDKHIGGQFFNVFCGSARAAFWNKEQGLLTGLLLGGLFAAALSGLLLMSGGLFDTPALLRMAAVLLCSCAGGVLGRALGEKKRRI